MFSEDKFHDECGLMAVWNHPEAANLAYLGLYAQQHRGQEGAGVVSVDRNGNDLPHFYVHKGLGLVADVFGSFDFTKLPGGVAIGHVRYTTAGGNRLANVQHFVADIALGHTLMQMTSVESSSSKALSSVRPPIQKRSCTS
jgi:amidophosphoribosyltransferase